MYRSTCGSFEEVVQIIGEESYWRTAEAVREKEYIDRYEEETGEWYVDPDGYDRYGCYVGLPGERKEEDMTWEELEKELVKWEKMLTEINEFYKAINDELRGENNATNKEER